MLVIDGSQGEGGGQILRTSLVLSLVTGTPFKIEKIRAGRDKPGLLRQHLTAVRAAATIGAAEVTGADMGSRELVFRPGPVTPGKYRFAVGTAGSATLVLQTVLPPLLIAAGPSELTLEGGTHNPHAPPFDFLARAFLPLVNRMGPAVTAELDRPGFYPAGGGAFRVRIEPAPLRPLDLPREDKIRGRRVRAVVANLPLEIADREMRTVARKLPLSLADCAAEELPGARSPGNYLTIEFRRDHVTEVITGIGQRGVRAEAVADAAVREARAYLDSGAPVGEHLADQLLLPLALAGGGSFFTVEPTPHTTTNIDVIRLFLPVAFTVERVGDVWRIGVGQTA